MAIVARDGVDGKVCSKCREWKVLEHYYSSKSSSDGYNNYCRPCAIQVAKNRAQKPEVKQATRERKRQRYAEDPEYRRRILDAQAATGRAHMVRWRKRNQNYTRQYSRNYRIKNLEAVKEKERRYYKENGDKVKIKNHRRRARMKSAPGTFTAEEWKAIKHRYHYICLRCGKREPEITLTIDHIIPLDKGGANDASNIQPLCGSCNSKKGTRTVDFRLEL